MTVESMGSHSRTLPRDVIGTTPRRGVSFLYAIPRDVILRPATPDSQRALPFAGRRIYSRPSESVRGTTPSVAKAAPGSEPAVHADAIDPSACIIQRMPTDVSGR